MNQNNDIAIRFSNVDFSHSNGKEILDEASFAIRQGSKIALMDKMGMAKPLYLI